MSNNIIPGKQIGPIKIGQNGYDFIRSFNDYEVTERSSWWCVETSNKKLRMGIKKSDYKISSIWTEMSEYNYDNKARIGMNFREFIENFPDWDLFSGPIFIPNVPGIEFYFTEEPEDTDNEEAYLDTTLIAICIFDPTINWTEEDKKPHLPCPFPDDKIVYRWNEDKPNVPE